MIEVTHREQYEQRFQGSQQVSILEFEGGVTATTNTSKLADRLPYCWTPPDARSAPNVERACQSRQLFRTTKTSCACYIQKGTYLQEGAVSLYHGHHDCEGCLQ